MVPESTLDAGKKAHDDGQTLFVDIRTPGHFEAAHVPGAQHLSDSNIAEFVAETPKESAIVVYCYHGNSSRGATAYLLEQGFQNVVSLQGGFEGWRSRQFPTTA